MWDWFIDQWVDFLDDIMARLQAREARRPRQTHLALRPSAPKPKRFRTYNWH